jgi:O-antigen ligase
MFQSIFGKNIIGLAMGDRPSSFFGTEHVAGGYIQKFSLFFIFLSAFYSKLKNQKYKNIFITFIISFVAIVLAGNRMPLIIFLSSFLVFFILQRNFKSVLVMVLVSVLIFFTIISFNKNLKSNASSFYSSVSRMVILAPKLFYHGKVEKDFSWGSGHLMVFNSGIQLWKKNKIFGSGLKSFRLNCSYVRFSTCESHPHNYSIEIMLETGLIGLILIYSFFLTNFFTFLKFYWKNSNLDLKFTIMPFFLIVLFEFFPLRSTGSFFTTSNSSVIFLTLAIFINFSKLNSFNKKFS